MTVRTGGWPARVLWRGLGRDYALFWAARVLAVAGATITAVALPLLAYRTSGGSAVATSAVAALQVLPYLLLGLLAGALADRLPRRRVLVAAELAAGATLLALAAVGDERATLPVIVLVAAVVPTTFVWFDAAAFGALPALVGRDRLAEANGALWSATTLVAVAGPAVGGVLVALVGPATTLAVDAAACLLAAVLLSRVRTDLGPHRSTGPLPSLTTDVREGLAFVARQPLVRALTGVGTLNAVAAGGVTGLVVVTTVEQLGRAADGPATGGLLATVSAGAFVAAFLLPRVVRRAGVGTVALAALAVGVPSLMVLARTTDVAVAALALLVWSTGSTLVVLNGITARQRVTPDHLQARVNTTARMLSWGGTPVGALLGGVLADRWGVATATTAAAVVLAVAVVVCGVAASRGSFAVEPTSQT